MNGRRAITGLLCTLCALLLSTVAAQSASAVTEAKGTTAFTCVSGAGTLRGEHCLTAGAGSATFGHVEIPADTTTEVTGTNTSTESETTTASNLKFKMTIGGVPVELQATGVASAGWMENRITPGGEHFVHGKATITFTGVSVKEPAGRNCKVYTDNEGPGAEGEAGIVHTRELTATTEGAGDNLNVKAADGGNIVNFFLTCEEGKKIPTIEGTWSCSGSVKGEPTGATINLTHATVTTENTLKCKGSKAGINGSLTLSGKLPFEESYKPLAQTTVTTEVPPPPIAGTTASTCEKEKGTLRGEHCLATGSAAAEYGHVAIAENTTTELSGTNAKTANETITRSTGRLKVTIAGVPLELTATSVEGLGSVENKKAPSGEHYTHLKKGTFTFTEILVANPPGRGCKVYTDNEEANTEGEAGVVHTRELTGTTEGQGDFLKFEPADGPEKSFAKFFMTCEEGKKIPAIEGTWECSGSVKGIPTGATTNFTHAATTAQSTLKCRGANSGIEGGLTLSGRESGSAGAYVPLAATTVET